MAHRGLGHLVVDGQTQIVLQPFLGGSWKSADPRTVVAGRGFLRVFCGMDTGLALVQGLNLH